MDFQAAQVDVLGEFAPHKPRQSKSWTFKASYPGIFMHHCGAMPLQQHIARGMYGAIIVGPKEGYSKRYLSRIGNMCWYRVNTSPMPTTIRACWSMRAGPQRPHQRQDLPL